MKRTEAQQAQSRALKERIHDSIVPKELRAQAIELVNGMPRGPMRGQTYGFVRLKGRKRSELEKFIERMAPDDVMNSWEVLCDFLGKSSAITVRVIRKSG
jgi:hypothetical protein